MIKQEKEKMKAKCERCKTNFMVWADGLDPDFEKTDDIKNHTENYCPACSIIEE